MTTLDARALSWLGDHLRRMVDEGEVAGTSLAIVAPGGVVHEHLAGSADRERQKPVTSDTIFRIASMTKPIASLALVQLYERGCFRLGDPVAAYIPEFAGLAAPDAPAGSRPMNMRDVLTHQTGLGEPLGPPEELRLLARDGRTLRDTVEDLAGKPLQFAPGTRWSYGVSTDIVGHLVEVLSGSPFDAYLREQVFEPLGMRDTGFEVGRHDADRLAANYAMAEDGLELIDDPATSPLLEPATYFSGAGGLVSTMPDYVRFARMLLGRGELDGARVLGSRTLAFMLENHLPGGRTLAEHGGIPEGFGPAELNMEANGFGLGFSVRIRATPGEVGSIGEYGWWGAFGTVFWVDPVEELAVIVMTQRRFALAGGGLWGPVVAPIRPMVYAALR